MLAVTNVPASRYRKVEDDVREIANMHLASYANSLHFLLRVSFGIGMAYDSNLLCDKISQSHCV